MRCYRAALLADPRCFEAFRVGGGAVEACLQGSHYGNPGPRNVGNGVPA